MTLDDAFLWYRRDLFTAEDVTRATGLSERSQRELIKTGVIKAVPQAKTKARLLSSWMVKRAAVIAPLSKAGLSLKVSGKIVYAAMTLEDLQFHVIDPTSSIFDPMAKSDPVRLAVPDPHGWFDPSKPPHAEEDDLYIEITNNRYVGIYTAFLGGPNIYGELTADHTDVVVWRGSVWNELISPSKPSNEHIVSMFSDANALVSPSRAYTWKEPTEAEQSIALSAWNNSISKLRVNAALALRTALRRLLRIDAPGEKSPWP